MKTSPSNIGASLRRAFQSKYEIARLVWVQVPLDLRLVVLSVGHPATFFKSGLKSYIEDCGYSADMNSYGSSDIGVSMDDVFNKSVSLIQDHTVHVLLLDYDGDMGMFPSHYVVVVGYNKFQTKRLIVCNGFGNDFQSIDFDDEEIKPVRVIWMTLKGADGPCDGHEIGPSGSYTWTTVNGQKRLTPSVIEPPTKTGTTPWRAADSTTFTAGSTCSINTWDN